jgi:hypothetical protein
MKDPQARASMARRAAQAVCLGIALFLPTHLLGFQHGGHGAPAPRSMPHPGARSMPSRPAPSRPAPARQGGGMRAPAGPAGGYRPQGSPSPQSAQRFRPGAQPQGNMRPGIGIGPVTAQPRPSYSMRPTPQAGHLPQWMQQHRNMPIGQQERLLRQEPGFNRLSPSDQQREIQQLQHLNQLPEPEQQRRLARTENIERLSPSERMQLNQSSREYKALPPDRQMLMRGAFRDLRQVPIDQRDTMLNSARYRSTFTPQERGILSNMLRVEPYTAPY